jgi:hypothetical protein
MKIESVNKLSNDITKLSFPEFSIYYGGEST